MSTSAITAITAGISAAAAVTAVLLLFLLLPFTVIFEGFVTMNDAENTGDFYVVLKLFKIINVKFNRTKLKELFTKALHFRKKRNALGKSQEDRKRLARVSTAFNIQQLVFNASVGTGDSALTALLAGAFYTLPSAIYSILCTITESEGKDSDFEITVCPDFEKTLFVAEFNCIFSAKPVNIILNYITERKFML